MTLLGGRRLLWLPPLAACLLLAVFAAMERGLRFPPLQFDPAPAATEQVRDGVRVSVHGAVIRTVSRSQIELRAFRPDFSVEILAANGFAGELRLENVWKGAAPRYEADCRRFRMRFEGLQRSATLVLEEQERLAFSFGPLPGTGRVFAAIGDTGGEEELRTAIQAAAKAGAEFLLHLGDIAYAPGEHERAREALLESPIPVYITPGNHEYHGDGAQGAAAFQRDFGPLNSWFDLAGYRFANLDTGTDILPVDAGARGALLEALAEEQRTDPLPLVLFTHRPPHDPRPDHQGDAAHAINRTREAEWLLQQAQELECRVWLSGHIHSSHAFVWAGLPIYVAGDGLANAGDESVFLIGILGDDGTPAMSWRALRR